MSVVVIFCGKSVLMQKQSCIGDTLLFIAEPVGEGEPSEAAVRRIQEEFLIQKVKFVCDGLLLTRGIPPMGFWYAARVRSFKQLNLGEELRWVPISEVIGSRGFEYLPEGIKCLLLPA